MRKIVLFPIILTIIFILNINTLLAQVEPPVILEMDDRATYTVLRNGDVQVKEVISLSGAAFLRFREQYPLLSMLTRLFKSQRLDAEFVDLKIDVDEANNKITATYIIKGISINRGDRWELTVASERGKVTLSAQTGNTFIFTFARAVTNEVKSIVTSTVILPEEAKNARFDANTNKIVYELPQPLQTVISSNIILPIAGVALIIMALINIIIARRRLPPPPPP